MRVTTRSVIPPRDARSQLRAMRCSSWRTYQLATPVPPCPDPMRSPGSWNAAPASSPIPGRASAECARCRVCGVLGPGGAGASSDSLLVSLFGSSNFGTSTASAGRGVFLRRAAWGAGVGEGATFPAPPVSGPLRATGKRTRCRLSRCPPLPARARAGTALSQAWRWPAGPHEPMRKKPVAAGSAPPGCVGVKSLLSLRPSCRSWFQSPRDQGDILKARHPDLIPEPETGS